MDKPIGRIQRDAVEIKNGSHTAGETLLTLNDIEIIKREETGFGLLRRVVRFLDRSRRERPANFIYDKKARLDERFWLGLGCFLRRPLGFGFHAGIYHVENQFSWEWFNIKDRNRAKKIQGTGEIYFETTETEEGVEISYTRFETDVSMRISTLGSRPLGPVWRINILKGTEIHWPHVSGGENKAAGYL